jgi:AcrR family transcriptional regulator
MLSNLKEEEKLDPRVKRTRSLILRSFESLLAEKNFESISVQDVTARAQINRATFYAHFEDKYKLLDHWISRMFMQELDKRMRDVCHYTPDNLRNLILGVCEFLSQLHVECAQPHQQFESLVETQIKQQIHDLLSHWLEESKTNVSTEIPATVATWAIYGLASQYSHSKERPSLEQFVDEALPLVAINLEQFAQPA